MGILAESAVPKLLAMQDAARPGIPKIPACQFYPDHTLSQVRRVAGLPDSLSLIH